MSSFSDIPHCLKEKCQLEAQNVTKLVMTIMDDYVFSEGIKKRAEQRLMRKELLQYIINCWLLCVVPVMNSAGSAERPCLQGGTRNRGQVSSEGCPWVGVGGRL